MSARSMPELPEVEITRRNLVHWLKDRRIVGAVADNTRTFRGAKRSHFEKLRGRLEALSRKGKYLLFTFEKDQGLLAHLGMTGKFVRRPAGVTEPYSRARLSLDNGDVIHFRDPRMFGRMETVAASGLQRLPVIRALGVDPMTDGLSPAQLEEAVGRSQQELKVALMDQGRIAGLGNIHAAEALFRARIHPARKPSSLSTPDWKSLAAAIHQTIAFALKREQGREIEYVEEPGARNPFLIYGRAGEPCGRCKTIVRSSVQGGRTTHFCPKCQLRKRR